MITITHYFLYKNGACAHQRKLFRELYPKGIPVCWKCLKKAQSQGLEVYWLNRFVQDLYSRNKICDWWRYRNFPELAKRFKTASWDIPYIDNDEKLKLLEKELLKRKPCPKNLKRRSNSSKSTYPTASIAWKLCTKTT